MTLVVLASACGDSNEVESGSDAPSSTPSTAEVPSSDNEDSDVVDDSGGSTKVVLTASATGVMMVDTGELANLGIVINSGDIEGQWRSFVDEVNRNNGILGRMLEPHFVTYSALSDSASEVACTKLTQDIEIFWVAGSILRDNPICFTDFNETIAFPAQPASPTAVERAIAPFRSLPPSQTDQAAVFAEASAAAGIYGDAPVGVIQAGADPGPVGVIADALRTAGLDVFEGPITASADDPLAVDRDIATLFERFRAEGVKTVVLAGIGVRPLEVAQNTGYDEFDFALATAIDSGIISRRGIDPALLDGVFSIAESLVGTADQELFRDDPSVERCVAIYEAVAGTGTVEFDPTAELANLGPTLQACDLIDVLVAIATAAGPDLTNESFGTAVESIGDLDLATVPFASGSAGKFGLSDTAIPVRYDADLLLWALDGDPINTRS